MSLAINLFLILVNLLLVIFAPNWVMVSFGAVFLILLSIQLGFKVGCASLMSTITRDAEQKGYRLYIDEESNLKIKRKYADFWYRDK